METALLPPRVCLPQLTHTPMGHLSKNFLADLLCVNVFVWIHHFTDISLAGVSLSVAACSLLPLNKPAFRINELNTQDAGWLSAAGFKIEIDAETTSAVSASKSNLQAQMSLTASVLFSRGNLSAFSSRCVMSRSHCRFVVVCLFTVCHIFSEIPLKRVPCI